MSAPLEAEQPAPSEIRIGVSACLLGQEVRFDGGHKRSRFVADVLSRFVTLVPVCPEVDIGLGTPREAIRLVDAGGVRLRGVRSGADHTDAMRSYSAERAAELEGRGLCGYVLKSKSPSCGLYRIPIYREEGRSPDRRGRGLFAEAITERMPRLPVEEEGRLEDPELRERFVTRVFAYARLRRALAPGWRMRDLVAFHASEKLLLLAHRPASYQALGRLVGAGESPELGDRYAAEFMDALAAGATAGRHVNVLQHIAGYVSEHLDAPSRRQLAEVIEDYGRQLVPLVVPVTLLQFFARRYEIDYLLAQSYLSPHPRELMLRNHL